MGTLNQSLRGWSNYFHFRNSSKALEDVKWFIEERVRIQLKRRYKVRCRKTALMRFNRDVLYSQYGLFPIPTHAIWKHNASQ
ncbi:MAG: hypothetical protein HQL48_07645 [Gammaproteobacteria bacterium]|nr:hypothetical protein [Gammaproteobacteria bacterium]